MKKLTKKPSNLPMIKFSVKFSDENERFYSLDKE